VEVDGRRDHDDVAGIDRVPVDEIVLHERAVDVELRRSLAPDRSLLDVPTDEDAGMPNERKGIPDAAGEPASPARGDEAVALAGHHARQVEDVRHPRARRAGVDDVETA